MPQDTATPPLRYPIPCVSFDLIVAAYIAYLASRHEKTTAGPAPAPLGRL